MADIKLTVDGVEYDIIAKVVPVIEEAPVVVGDAVETSPAPAEVAAE